jgi:hypothetical protein
VARAGPTACVICPSGSTSSCGGDGPGSRVVAPASHCRSSARPRRALKRTVSRYVLKIDREVNRRRGRKAGEPAFLPLFPKIGEQRCRSPVALLELERWTGMTELSQLANAVVAVVFAAVLLVGGQWFIEHRTAKNPVMPGLAAAATRVAATR